MQFPKSLSFPVLFNPPGYGCAYMLERNGRLAATRFRSSPSARFFPSAKMLCRLPSEQLPSPQNYRINCVGTYS